MNNIHYCNYCKYLFLGSFLCCTFHSYITNHLQKRYPWGLNGTEYVGYLFQVHIDMYLLIRFRTDEVDVTWRS